MAGSATAVARLKIVRVRGQERGDADPAGAPGQRSLPNVGDVAVARLGEIDRRAALPGERDVVPGGRQELLAGAQQLLGTILDALRLQQHHPGAAGHEIDHRLHLLDQQRGDGLHALGPVALRHRVQQIGQLRVLRQQGASASADRVGERQFATRRREQAVRQRLQGALIGHCEGADLVHLVAEELQAHRVRLGRREHVQDAAAQSELAAPLHQIGTGVADAHQLAGQLGRIGLTADPDGDRFGVGGLHGDRLQQGPHRHHDHCRHRGGRSVAGPAHPTQHRHATTDHIRRRAQPFVRQRLPRREHCNRGRVEVAGQLVRHILRLPSRRSDRHDGPIGSLGQQGEQRVGNAGGGGHLDRSGGTCGAAVQRRADSRLCGDERQQGGQGHAGSQVRGGGIDLHGATGTARSPRPWGWCTRA